MLLKQNCDNCRFCRGHTIVEGHPTGWCHRNPPFITGAGSAWTPIYTEVGWCGEHRYSLSGFFRAIGALFRRK